MRNIDDFIAELPFEITFDMETGEDKQSFNMEDIKNILTLYKEESENLLNKEKERRRNHVCTMGYHSCNERGYCDGSC